MLASLFPNNEHRIERILRVVLGLGITSLAFVGPQTPWAFAGLIFVVTGAAGTCPIYTVLGVSTCPTKVKA